MAWVG
jgi:hypothetical protein